MFAAGLGVFAAFGLIGTSTGGGGGARYVFRGGGTRVVVDIIAASSSSLSSKPSANWDAYVDGGTFDDDAVSAPLRRAPPPPPTGLMNDVATVPNRPVPGCSREAGSRSLLALSLARRSVDRVTDLGVAFLRHDGA